MSHEHVVIARNLEEFLLGLSSLLFKSSNQDFYVILYGESATSAKSQLQVMDKLSSIHVKHNFNFYYGKRVSLKTINSFGPDAKIYIPSVFSNHVTDKEIRKKYLSVATHTFSTRFPIVHGCTRVYHIKSSTPGLEFLINYQNHSPIMYLERIVPIEFDVPKYSKAEYPSVDLYIGMCAPTMDRGALRELIETHKDRPNFIPLLIAAIGTTDFWVSQTNQYGGTTIFDPRPTHV